ncbi:MAG: arsenic resistance N-acetyltransferase ArsN2 [Steroidobacteraceae bacterium]
MGFATSPPLQPVGQLLEQCGLPTGDLTPALMAQFLYAGPASQPSGVVGLEMHGAVALLRSLAVAPDQRTGGLGRALVVAAEGAARAQGVAELFLLTQTAAAYFERLGYQRAPRDAAPPAIRATGQFTSLCPDSAVLMRKPLQ